MEFARNDAKIRLKVWKFLKKTPWVGDNVTGSRPFVLYLDSPSKHFAFETAGTAKVNGFEQYQYCFKAETLPSFGNT